MSVHEPRRRDRFAKLFASRKKGKDDTGSTIEEPPSPKLEPHTTSKSQSAVLPPSLESKETDVQRDPSSNGVDASHTLGLGIAPKTTDLWMLASEKLDSKSAAILNMSHEDASVRSSALHEVVEALRCQCFNALRRIGTSV